MRALVASTVALALALAGHKLGGGEGAALGVTTATFGAVFTLSWILGTRRVTAGQIVGFLLLAQMAVHLGCVFGATMAPLDAAMVGGHVVATGLTALILARGERFLWSVAERLGLRADTILTKRLSRLPSCIARRMLTSDDPRSPACVFAGGNGLRGPPVGCI